MALIPIPGQPINMVANNEGTSCIDDGSYCAVYKKDDLERVFFQVQQTPAFPTILANGNFASGSSWTADANVIINDNKATHIAGTSGEILQDLSASLDGQYYQIKVTVTGMTAGTIDLYFTKSGTASKTITENGIYTFYLYDVGDNDNITFVFSSDCDGSISQAAVYKLIGDTDAATLASLYSEDGTFIGLLTPILIDDFIIFSKFTSTIDEGCYTITLIDPNADNEVEIFTNPDFITIGGAWSALTSCSSMDCGQSLLGDEVAQYLGTVPPTNTYVSQVFNSQLDITEDCFLKFDFTIEADDFMDIIFFTYDGGTYTPIKTFSSVATGTYSSTVFFAANSIPSGTDMGVLMVGYEPKVIGANILEYAQITKRPAYDSGYFQSNCISVRTDVTGTRLIEGFADLINSFPLGNKSLGFMFLENYFWLRLRVPVQFSNPHHPIKSDNNLFSNGVSKKAFAIVGKVWDLTIYDCDQVAHDTMANIINCDKFKIDSVEYITDEKEYTVNYGAKGMNTMGESIIEVARIDGTRINVNV